jgi:small-conductance mechanosensitive channel
MNELSEIKGYLFDSLNQFIQNVGAYLPNLLGAITLLVIGLILAWLVKWLILRLGAGIDRVVQAVGITSLHLRLKWPIAEILGWVMYWLVVLLFLRAALASLKLPLLSELLGRLITYLPNVFIGVVFIIGGIVIGNMIRDKIRVHAHTVGFRQADMMGGLIRVSIIILAVIVGLAQIGLDVRLFELILTIFIASLAGSIGLAFGLGAGTTVSNIIASRYVRKNYQVGQQIRIHELEGKILEINPTGIVVDTKSGRTFIPAKLFDTEASVLLDDESLDDD